MRNDAPIVLAEWAAVAIDNARAYASAESRRAELERAVSSLEATTAIAQTLAGETDLDNVLELVVKRARALTDARAMVVLLPRGDDLAVMALAGDLDHELLGERIPIEGSVSGEVFRSGRPERLADASSRLRVAFEKQTGATTGLVVALRFRGRSLGVLAAFDRLGAEQEFSPRDEHVLTGFAASAAAAIATAQDVAEQTGRRSIAAAESERARWARELHDDTLQELAALKLLLAAVRRSDAERWPRRPPRCATPHCTRPATAGSTDSADRSAPLHSARCRPQRNRVVLPYRSPEDVRRAYEFSDLQSFLDIYYQGTRVLLRDRDFYDLTRAYLQKAHEQNVRHAEIFFDPQAHTVRNVPIEVIIEGIHDALNDGKERFGISSNLILCFLRHLSGEDAMRTLKAALPYRHAFAGVGLDSSECGHPPEKFIDVFAWAREEGLFVVAHAGDKIRVQPHAGMARAHERIRPRNHLDHAARAG
jgi:GAF domain-containing protein